MQTAYYRYRINQLKISLIDYIAAANSGDTAPEGSLYPGEPMELIRKAILRELRKGKDGKKGTICDLTLIRKSIDARDKEHVKLVYTVDFTTGRKLVRCPRNIAEAPDLSYPLPEPGRDASRLSSRPVVVGFGPCGMFAALLLARQGYRPLVIERGACVEERVKVVEKFWKEQKLDPECNVQFGEGGAGTFSDGKLTTGIHDPRVRLVLSVFQEHGADPSVLYDQKPHIGTDVLRKVVRNIREEIESLGGTVCFRTRMEEIECARTNGGNEGCVTAIRVVQTHSDGKEESFRIPTDVLLLAPGHSSRDTFRMLHAKGIPMQQKALSIGVRIEHPQSLIDVSQYGKKAVQAGILPPAAYKLAHHTESGRGVYTFCMCPGGEVIPASSEEGGMVVNGMSCRARNSGTANAALLVDVRTEDFGDPQDPLAGVKFQERFEHAAFRAAGNTYLPPETCYGDFRDGAEAAKPVLESLPEFAVESIREAMPVFGRKIQGFDRDDAVMKAVETRSSSPVRILRDRETLESLSLFGLYPGGEGAGYAGGITSSACDGLRIAEKVIEKWLPAKESESR